MTVRSSLLRPPTFPRASLNSLFLARCRAFPNRTRMAHFDVTVSVTSRLFRVFRGRNYEPGLNALLIVTASFPATKPSCLSWRTRLAPLWLNRCPRKALRCFTLPEAVTLNLFCIPLCVFCLGIPSSPHLFLTIRLFRSFLMTAQSKSQHHIARSPGKRGIIAGMPAMFPARMPKKCGLIDQNQTIPSRLESERANSRE